MDKLITIKIVKISQYAEKELSQKTTMLKPANIVLYIMLTLREMAGRERENENDRGRRKEGDNKGFARAEEEEMQNVG